MEQRQHQSRKVHDHHSNADDKATAAPRFLARTPARGDIASVTPDPTIAINPNIVDVMPSPMGSSAGLSAISGE